MSAKYAIEFTKAHDLTALKDALYAKLVRPFELIELSAVAWGGEHAGGGASGGGSGDSGVDLG